MGHISVLQTRQQERLDVPQRRFQDVTSYRLFKGGYTLVAGQVAGQRKQEKPRMRWLDSIKEATGLRLEDLKEAVKDRKKWRTLVEEKTRNRVRTDVKWIQEKAMANHSCTAKLA